MTAPAGSRPARLCGRSRRPESRPLIRLVCSRCGRVGGPSAAGLGRKRSGPSPAALGSETPAPACRDPTTRAPPPAAALAALDRPLTARGRRPCKVPALDHYDRVRRCVWLREQRTSGALAAKAGRPGGSLCALPLPPRPRRARLSASRWPGARGGPLRGPLRLVAASCSRPGDGAGDRRSPSVTRPGTWSRGGARRRRSRLLGNAGKRARLGPTTAAPGVGGAPPGGGEHER